MGVKRLSRGKLLNTEKFGIEKKSDIDTGIGMEKAIASATQHREGYKVITDIVVDLGTSKDTIKTGGATATTPVGAETDGGVAQLSYIAKLASSVFGVVTSVECVCLEMPTDGVLLGSTTNAYRLLFADAAGKIGNPPGSIVTVHADMDTIGVVGEHSITSFGDGEFDTASELNDKYVYIATGAGADVKTAATATITVGSAEGESITIADVFTDGVSRISLTKADGVLEHKFFDLDGAQNYNGTQVAGTINAKTATTAAHIAAGIVVAFNGGSHSDFTAAAGGSPNTHVVTVTQTATGVGGNKANFLADAPGKTAPVVVTDFTGGTTSGTSTAMTAGKFLIRVTGFMTPDDL